MLKLKYIFQQLKNYKIILLGGIMFLIYIWARFIRTRLPKDIPFTPSVTGFFILLEICGIYAYITWSLMRPPKEPNKLVEDLMLFIYKPLENFDYFWKHLKIIQKKYKKFILSLADKMKYFIVKTNIFYFIFAIFPRLLLISVMFIDVFLFHKLHYIYKILLVGIFLFLNKYIIYSFKAIKLQLLTKFKLYVNTIGMSYVYGVHPDDNEDDEDWEPQPTMALPPEIFVDYQTKNIVYKNTKPIYSLIDLTDFYVTKYDKKYNISLANNTPEDIRDLLRVKRHKLLDRIINLSVLIEYYNLSGSHKDLKLIKKLIFINYLIYWIYIFIVSLPNLDLLDLVKVMNVTWVTLSNPFF